MSNLPVYVGAVYHADLKATSRRGRVAMRSVLLAASALCLTILYGHPASAASLSVTCRLDVQAANMTPNRRVPGVGVTYGNDVAVATVVCASLTGDTYDLWVDIAIYDAADNRIAFEYGRPLPAVQGVGFAVTNVTALGYDEGSSAPVPRTHRVSAWAYVDACAACPGELVESVAVEFAA